MGVRVGVRAGRKKEEGGERVVLGQDLESTSARGVSREGAFVARFQGQEQEAGDLPKSGGSNCEGEGLFNVQNLCGAFM